MLRFIKLPWENTIIRTDDVSGVKVYRDEDTKTKWIIDIKMFEDFDIKYKCYVFDTQKEALDMFNKLYELLNKVYYV